MTIIYVDNFRGFNEAFLELKDVNFFVGENSTGKTSLLKLINRLSSDTFWFDLDLNSEDSEFGYYSEIVNQHSDKKHFDVGIISLSYSKDKLNHNVKAAKIRYVNKDGQPNAESLWILDKGLNIQTSRLAKNIKYKYCIVDDDEINKTSELEFFQNWIRNTSLNEKKYTTVQSVEGQAFKGNLFFQLQVIKSKIKEEKKEKNHFNISVPKFIESFTWLAPIRTEPRRTYDSYKTKFNPTGSHTPYILKAMLRKASATKSKSESEDINVLNKFGKDSGLFDKVEIKTLTNSETSPFEIHILLNGNPLKITNVGYGISQVLPVIIESIIGNLGTWFAIQQPEIHLHPKGQAAFGDLIFDLSERENKKFIIETHSDFIIDRYRIRINQKKREYKKSSQIIFFKRDNKGNKFYHIDINNDGSLTDNQPSEFRDFFIREELKLIQI